MHGVREMGPSRGPAAIHPERRHPLITQAADLDALPAGGPVCEIVHSGGHLVKALRPRLAQRVHFEGVFPTIGHPLCTF